MTRKKTVPTRVPLSLSDGKDITFDRDAGKKGKPAKITIKLKPMSVFDRPKFVRELNIICPTTYTYDDLRKKIVDALPTLFDEDLEEMQSQVEIYFQNRPLGGADANVDMIEQNEDIVAQIDQVIATLLQTNEDVIRINADLAYRESMAGLVRLQFCVSEVTLVDGSQVDLAFTGGILSKDNLNQVLSLLDHSEILDLQLEALAISALTASTAKN
jgi:hypothetical protein